MTKPNDPVQGQFHGLTKREFFAAMALQGVLASNNEDLYADAAEEAVIAADELIEELNKEACD